MESSKHQHQATATNPLEEALSCPSDLPAHHHHHHHHQQLLQQQDRKPAPPAPEQALSCPRCNSTNTKFCYYNNYSLSQPRYFCKGCRRYWTKGGTLRNVPVGGGCRKNKRSSSSSKKSQDQNYIIPTCSFGALLPSLSPPPPPLVFDPHALTFAFSALHKPPALADGDHIGDLALGSFTGGAGPLPPQAPGTFLDVLRTGFLDSSAGAFDDDLYYYGFSGGHHGNGEDVEEGDVAEERASTAPFFFEGGLGGSTAITQLAAQEASCKGTADGDHNWLFMGLQRQVNGGDGRGGIAVDPGRDYNWNGTTGSSNWHGLVNIAP